MDIQIQKFLFDIHQAINSINEYIGEVKDYNNYLKDKMLRRAVERELEIIGEALNKINKIDETLTFLLNIK